MISSLKASFSARRVFQVPSSHHPRPSCRERSLSDQMSVQLCKHQLQVGAQKASNERKLSDFGKVPKDLPRVSVSSTTQTIGITSYALAKAIQPIR